MGSHPSFDSLVAEAYGPLQRYLRRRTDLATADDVLGDVLLVVAARRSPDAVLQAPVQEQPDREEVAAVP